MWHLTLCQLGAGFFNRRFNLPAMLSRLGKLGFLSPREACQAYAMRQAA
jgi:hypothetical protein